MTENPQTAQADRAATDRKRAKESAIVKQSAGLAPYGTAEELAILVGRFKTMVPGADKLKSEEVWALAQASFMHGLNPIIGECYWINGFAPGIKGIRRKAHEQVRERYGPNHDWRIEAYRQITKPTELDAFKIPAGALAFEADLVIDVELDQHANNMKMIREALGKDAPYDVVLAQAGPRPVTIGIGYVTQEQMDELDNPRWFHKCDGKEKAVEAGAPIANNGKVILRGQADCPYCGYKSYAKPSAMPHVQRAQKRAEAHAIKQRFDLPFDFNPNAGEMLEEEWDYGDVIPGDFEVVGDGSEFDSLAAVAAEAGMTPEEALQYLNMVKAEQAGAAEAAERTPEENKARAEEGKQTLYPTDDGPEPEPIGKEKRNWTEDHIKALQKNAFIPAGDKVNPFEVRGRLNKSPFRTDDPIKWIGEWMLLYAKYRSNSKPDEAAAKATRAFKDEHQGDQDVIARFGQQWLDMETS